MINRLLLCFVLAILWLGLSGLYKPLILGLGVVSIFLVLTLTGRLGLYDADGVPYRRFLALARYSLWLLGEIAKSNYRVIRACLASDLDIKPTLTKVKTTCESDLAKTVFGNSITLTPGTITIAVEGEKLLVHGLYEDDCDAEAFTEMNNRALRATQGMRPDDTGLTGGGAL